VNNPFGSLLVDKLEFTANFFSFGPADLGNSDFSLMAISLIDPPADPVQLSGPGSAQITIDKAKLGADCSSDLVDFPLLVEIANDPRLRHKSHGGAVENINGYDIIFKDAFNQLAHEVEYYDGSTGSLIAWVKIPALSVSANTVITMQYGDPGITTPTENPEAVWNSHYKGVYHLNQRPQSDGKIYDSTINALDLTPQKGNPDSNRVPAAVGYGLKFRGWDYLISSKNLSLSNGGKFTYETWVKSSSYWGGRQAVVSIQDGNTHGSRTLTSYDSPMGMGIQYNYDVTPPTYRIANKQPNDTWVHLVARYDGTKVEGFVNGVQTQFTYYPGWGPVTGVVTLGVWRGETGWLNWFLTEGYLDEVRISDGARDSCYIQTTYTNQSDPSSFYTVGYGGEKPM
jgi:MSHA biogenesis protein MshQ